MRIHEAMGAILLAIGLVQTNTGAGTAGSRGGPLVTEFWPATATFPVSLHDVPVGTTKTITVSVDRDLDTVAGAALELLIDDIDAKREAVITFNGIVLEVSDDLLGEGTGPRKLGFRDQLELPLDAVRRGENQVTLQFADNLGGSTAGYLVLDANLALRVTEAEADLTRTRDLGPELQADADPNAYARGLTGYTPTSLRQIVREQAEPAERRRIAHRGLFRPALVRLADGTWLACCDYRYEGTVWRLKMLRSTDEGMTWAELETAGVQLLGANPRLTVCRGQRLFLTAWHQYRLFVYRSADGGAIWTGVALPEGLRACRELLETEDGGLEILASSGTYYSLGASPARVWVYTSRDGTAWTARESVSAWDHPEPPFEQGCIQRLQDGTLVAAGRVTGNVRIPDRVLPHPPSAPLPWMKGSHLTVGDESGDHMIMARSQDRGRSWTGFEPLTDYSAVHAHLLPLADGRLLCTYAQRRLPFGIYAVISDDGGHTWNNDRRVRLAVSQTADVGWPVSIALPDGSIATAYGLRPYLEDEIPGTTLDRAAELVRWQPD